MPLWLFSAADAAVSVSVADALPLPLPQLLLILLTPLLLRYRSFIVHYCLILISPPSLALSKPDVLRCAATAAALPFVFVATAAATAVLRLFLRCHRYCCCRIRSRLLLPPASY